MYAFAIFTFALASLASGLFVPRHNAPKNWDTAGLENYTVYHERYQALNCQDKHNTDFSKSCCHPLLANETLASRPAECTPTATTPAAPAADVVDPQDCDNGDDNSTTPPAAVAPAPSTTSSEAPPAAPTPEPAPAPSPSPEPAVAAAAPAPAPAPAPAAAPAVDDSNVNSGGYATFFYQNGNAGACGNYHSDSDYVAALDSRIYNGGQHCGQYVNIKNPANGRSVRVLVADMCPTCVSPNSIDLSVAAFNVIGDPSQGTFPIVWTWN